MNIQIKFIASLTKEISDESNPENVRMLAAVIFKNFVGNRTSVSHILHLPQISFIYLFTP